MCKFPLTGCLQIICKNFFAKLVQYISLCQAFQKAKSYKNLTPESGSKQRFSLLREKSIKARFRTGKFFGKVGKCQQPQTIYF